MGFEIGGIMPRFICVHGSNRQSEHVKPERTSQSRPAKIWYVKWKCRICHHTWTTDAGTDDQPDYKKEV
jgi:hypothetical protein